MYRNHDTELKKSGNDRHNSPVRMHVTEGERGHKFRRSETTRQYFLTIVNRQKIYFKKYIKKKTSYGDNRFGYSGRISEVNPKKNLSPIMIARLVTVLVEWTQWIVNCRKPYSWGWFSLPRDIRRNSALSSKHKRTRLLLYRRPIAASRPRKL